MVTNENLPNNNEADALRGYIGKLRLSREDAAKAAEKYQPKTEGQSAPDPFPKIPASLLSAEHIRDYVLETGLISPFYLSNEKKSPVKKAAYEGKIGNVAYLYNKDGERETIFDPRKNDNLIVPANSIVFVECDIDFRLPEFIALRFNLQIQHVHRGLLLGTGPLIDPGFWGKLCIPLHNLTDKEYPIPRNEGLIWLEFTKTTSAVKDGETPIGRRPLGTTGGFWEIDEYLKKASKQNGPCEIPIRSSLPSMFYDSKRQAEEARDAASKAKKSADDMLGLGFLGVLAVVIGVAALWGTFYSEIRAQNRVLEPRLSAAETAIEGHLTGLNSLANGSAEIQFGLDEIALAQERTQNELAQKISNLESQIESLSKKAEEYEVKLNNLQTLSGQTKQDQSTDE